MKEIKLPFTMHTLLPVRIIFGVFLFGFDGWLNWEYFQQSQHPFSDVLCLVAINVFFIGIFAYQLSVTITCDEDGFVLKRFFVKTAQVRWSDIKKVQMKTEGRGYIAIKIYHENALWGWPISLGARTFSFNDKGMFSELLFRKAKNANLKSMEAYRKNWNKQI